jgi:hypothetical protein
MSFHAEETTGLYNYITQVIRSTNEESSSHP